MRFRRRRARCRSGSRASTGGIVVVAVVVGGVTGRAAGVPSTRLLPAHAVSPFAGVGYHGGLARLLPGERAPARERQIRRPQHFAARVHIDACIPPYRDRHGYVHLPLDATVELARAFAAAEPTTRRSGPSSVLANSRDSPDIVASALTARYSGDAASALLVNRGTLEANLARIGLALRASQTVQTLLAPAVAGRS